MADRLNSNGSARALKVSHSLPASLVDRLKELAYWERVSESSIIEFVLDEFFALGDNATLGAIVRRSSLSNRRGKAKQHADALSVDELRDDLMRARETFSDAVEAWKRRPCLSLLRAVDRARLDVAAVRGRIARVAGLSVIEAWNDPIDAPPRSDGGGSHFAAQ